jgi:predicted O-methyltransferase YrrM
VEIGRLRNIGYAGQYEALQQTAAFASRHMHKVATFADPIATLDHALSLAPSGGLALEFGVFSGKTLRVIADARKDGRVYGFDSFEGLPEAWRAGFPAGAFATGTIPETPGAELVVGWFDATLPQFLVDHTDPVDFVHVDCDLYSSTKTVLDLIGRRLRPGSVLIFDEYFNYPGWQEHEHKAWMEYAERTGTRFVFEAYTYNNEQVTLRIVE